MKDNQDLNNTADIQRWLEKTQEEELLGAVIQGSEDRVKDLLAEGANINVGNCDSIKDLCNAAYYDNEAAIQMVLKHTLDLNGLTNAAEQISNDADTPERMEADPFCLFLSDPRTVEDYEAKRKVEGSVKLRLLILQEEDRRKMQIMQTFLLAIHPRLGKDSPAHVLSQYLFQEIYEHLQNQ